MKKIYFIAILLIIEGCVHRPRLSREEWLNATSKYYDGLTKEQVISAAEQLFILCDGDDFQLVHTEDGIIATRNWTVYLVLAASIGTDYWLLKVTNYNNGVKATIQINTQAQGVSGMPNTNGGVSAYTSALAGNPVNGNAIYDLFWSRMDYLLGKRPNWMSCEIADERIKSKIVWGSNEALCNSFNVDDKSPSAPIIPFNSKD